MTDKIERFTKTGIKLASGEELEADIIVTATGLNLQLFGGAEVMRNGVPIELNDTMAYKGMMLTHMPNMAFTIGYTNASWTLKADLVSEFVCRVLNIWTPRALTPSSAACRQHRQRRPLMNFTPGYVLRALDYLEVGSRRPVAAQAELATRSAADPARQGRRRSAGVHQTPCAGEDSFIGLQFRSSPGATTTMPSSSL